jgi:hypothetical protein
MQLQVGGCGGASDKMTLRHFARPSTEAAMPCPFPGMDPYIEREEIWGDFQWHLAVEISCAVQPLVKPELVAMVERLPYDEERFQIETLIVNPADPKQIVTAVEVLSIENKRAGNGRSAYLARRDHYVSSGVNVVEIDLLRTGERVLSVRSPTGGLPPSSYLVCVRRRPTQIDVYPVALQQRLPTIPIPLRPGQRDVQLDLQFVFARCWDEGPYPELLNYHQPPPGELSESEHRWCREQLMKAGIGTGGPEA